MLSFVAAGREDVDIGKEAREVVDIVLVELGARDLLSYGSLEMVAAFQAHRLLLFNTTTASRGLGNRQGGSLRTLSSAPHIAHYRQKKKRYHPVANLSQNPSALSEK
jgi:hypothetical protein